ncbi:MAG: N-acetyltransferase [Gammaproteobacteria bacterium]|nr:N-acetyltransferase [Gammaproteobacteria bacterium]
MMDSSHPIGFLVPNWTPPAQPGRSVIEGRYCRLTPLDAKAHANDLFAAFSADKENFDWLYLPYGPFDTLADLTSWLTDVSSKDDPLFFTITTPRILQRTPAATEVMYLMMKQAFELGYRRYEWKCNALNERSRRAALRLGLSYEGIFRQAAVPKGRNRDTAWYAAIDSEWPALKAAFETWLDPANFDSAGMQRRPLTRLTAGILNNPR